MRRKIDRLVLLPWLCILAAPACDWSSNTSSGLNSVIRVQGAQAKSGSIAGPAPTIPAMVTLTPRNATIHPGESNKSINGDVGPNANSVALGVAGDDVYWLLPALQPAENPGYFRYLASFSLSPALASSPLLQPNPDGTQSLVLPLSYRAVDNEGHFGPVTIQPLVLDSNAITGTLAVSLQWDTPTDLDLHVLVRPSNAAGYVEVSAKHRSLDPGNSVAGTSPDGTLDFDSNANCQIDGRDLENVIWTGPPPVGHYVVRVAAASLCGLTSAAWYAYASVPGVSKGEASGVLTEAAVRSSAGEGSGVTVFEFDYP
jgi:hypothetical protein